jgi:hypothetical protein
LEAEAAARAVAAGFSYGRVARLAVRRSSPPLFPG